MVTRVVPPLAAADAGAFAVAVAVCVSARAGLAVVVLSWVPPQPATIAATTAITAADAER